MLEFDLPKEQSSIIKVIGIGGGGSNAVNYMYTQGIRGVNFIIGNTDAQALEISPIPNKIQLGPACTEGLGAGSNPDIGKLATEESLDEIRSLLEKNTKMVFVTAGMGGGTGTGGAPVVAQLARSMGILTVGICTMPFTFEGRRKMKQAEQGMEELRNSVDSLIVISNDKIREMYGDLTRSEAFAQADGILTIAAKSISEIITVAGQINVDFADVEYVMKNSGVAIMGSATAEGEGRAARAIESALSSPLLNDNDIRGAQKILLNISSGTSQVKIDEITEIHEYVQEAAGNDTDVIFGTCDDETLGDKISVTIIATGFEKRNSLTENYTFASATPKKVVHTLDNPVATAVKPAESVAETPAPSIIEEPVLETKVEVSNTFIPAPEEKEEVLYKLEEEFTFSLSDTDAPEEEKAFVKEEAKEGSFTFSLFDAGETKKPEEPVFSQPKEEPFQFSLREEPKKEEFQFRLKEEPKVEEPVRSEEDLTQIANERMRKLRSLTMKLNNPGGMNELESEPAFKRRNIQLTSAPASAESNYSKYTFGNAEDGGVIRRNNSFLHDNVD
ncbi:MAG: cell division protein FtsZ [Chitinophagales bacterium]|nr:cell division protein FtsZ [Chitinophagales bacterium]